MLVDVTFTHHGLAAASLALALLTTITGVALTGVRHGLPPRYTARVVVRWSHITLGAFVVAYLVATYVVVPL